MKPPQDRLRISELLGQYYDIVSEVDPCTTLEPDRQERDRLRVAVGAIAPQGEGSEHRWMLQTSNSFRRIGTSRGDGDVLHATTQYDGHPDLQAAPGVLDYIVAAQPFVVLSLLEDLDAAEDKLRQTRAVLEKISSLEKRIDNDLAGLCDAHGRALVAVRSVLATLRAALDVSPTSQGITTMIVERVD